MFGRHLHTKLIWSFLAVIVLPSLAAALLGHHIIKRDIIDRAQTQVTNDRASGTLNGGTIWTEARKKGNAFVFELEMKA